MTCDEEKSYSRKILQHMTTKNKPFHCGTEHPDSALSHQLRVFFQHLCNSNRSTHGPCGCSDGDGRDEGEVVPGIHSVPQRRKDKGHRHGMVRSPVIAHTREREESGESSDWLEFMCRGGANPVHYQVRPGLVLDARWRVRSHQ